MVADRLHLLRMTIVAVLSVGRSPDISEDSLCLDRVSVLNDAFSAVVYRLRSNTLSNYGMWVMTGLGV